MQLSYVTENDGLHEPRILHSSAKQQLNLRRRRAA